MQGVLSARVGQAIWSESNGTNGPHDIGRGEVAFTAERRTEFLRRAGEITDADVDRAMAKEGEDPGQTVRQQDVISPWFCASGYE